MTTRVFHRGYLLSCQAKRLEDGRHRALCVVIAMGGDKTRSQIFLDLEVFDSPDAALGRAAQAGTEWVDGQLRTV
jgi:hypothetical protein